ncbi:hypothetical protein A6R68_12596 [Neotoma lepida]|uniref:DUF1899 domain-containing protein n=1 Tax=Neotoma lepida TaxID=56216 RepID=A0A1A6H2J9_NEOLE|nr:hypothetical protein A6R68_12596 [Neotoma lepida]
MKSNGPSSTLPRTAASWPPELRNVGSQTESETMSWHPQYRSSKFRHVYGKPASKENCYDSVPITRSVHDNHFCAVNPHFIAVVTECAGGGAFLVIPLHQAHDSLVIHLYAGRATIRKGQAPHNDGLQPRQAQSTGMGERQHSPVPC